MRMGTHPFVSRTRAERIILDAVNSHCRPNERELAGLSPKALAAWTHTELPSRLPLDKRLRLLGRLQDVSVRLRLASAASHRPAVVIPVPEDDAVMAEAIAIKALLSS